ncbi:hypothetical protein BDP81DRAFT_422618 [Colletotrichum phormii]|uniref:Uncharacterized protein n=1 Tax=Colletotrichum phormii TaxID=359342 RepID=A0AAI9ZV46_9PEZI|nr:uncharacterized protein BDP81DRAFT_422618 [Colletotrichum phormii]KAK1638765.1 hypothetical protein BDP81DRAFT_422618 [Colletotrichum phormii]
MTCLCRQTLRFGRYCPPLSHGSVCCRLLTSREAMLINELSMSTVLETPRKSLRPGRLKQILPRIQPAMSTNEQQAFVPHPSPFPQLPVSSGLWRNNERHSTPSHLATTDAHAQRGVALPRVCDTEGGERGFRVLTCPANSHDLKHGILFLPLGSLGPSPLRRRCASWLRRVTATSDFQYVYKNHSRSSR